MTDMQAGKPVHGLGKMTESTSGSSRRIARPPRIPDWRFGDREQAGQELARRLGEGSFERPLVLGIPTGGVVLAAEVAKGLGAELGLVVTRKLQAPYQPGLTLGAVTADNVVWIYDSLAEEVGARNGYLAAEIHRRAREARRLERELGDEARPMVRGRTVLVIDDGIVTGAQAIVALRSLRRAGASQVVFAAAVGPPEAFERIRNEPVEVVSLREDPHFVAVPDFFADCSPVSWPRVRQALAATARRLVC